MVGYILCYTSWFFKRSLWFLRILVISLWLINFLITKNEARTNFKLWSFAYINVLSFSLFPYFFSFHVYIHMWLLRIIFQDQPPTVKRCRCPTHQLVISWFSVKHVRHISHIQCGNLKSLLSHSFSENSVKSTRLISRKFFFQISIFLFSYLWKPIYVYFWRNSDEHS